MKIIYSNKHKNYNPTFAFNNCEKIKHFEKSSRIENIYKALKDGPYEIISPNRYPDSYILKIHANDYFSYLSTAYDQWIKAGCNPEGVVPDVFSRHKNKQRLKGIFQLAGWYCFDTNTPIIKNTFSAALSSAYCAITAAELLGGNNKSIYALCRPPGHHAGSNYFGGYCFFNNAALAAKYLLESNSSKIAIIDLDYHHGNGIQDIFYNSEKVYYASIHGDPSFEYPYFWGNAKEIGLGRGKGFNTNFPLPAGTTETIYLETLENLLTKINSFNPEYLIISLGTDTYKDDPIGTFNLEAESFAKIGKLVSEVNKTTLIIQEGGYNVNKIGECVCNFLKGFNSK
jgi:acetoin utilization deacetylase AcuC-like enzyme